MAVYQVVVERHNRLVSLIPVAGKGVEFPCARELIERMSSDYPGQSMRVMQRDLTSLVNEQRIAVVNTKTKPLRYRRYVDESDSGPGVQAYIREVVKGALSETLSKRQLEQVWSKLNHDKDGTPLMLGKIKVVTDTLRLTPALVEPSVLATVLEALALSYRLKISYRDAKNKASSPLLHPQGLLQRGPRVYLYAVKEEDPTVVRMYALHRMIRAEIVNQPSTPVPGFDLQRKIDLGLADFSNGEQVNLKIRVRGYVADLLRDCVLNESQRIDEEPEGSDFEMVVKATLPATGQLLRWLLGCGNNIQVLEPESLKAVVASQVAQMVSLYTDPKH